MGHAPGNLSQRTGIRGLRAVTIETVANSTQLIIAIAPTFAPAEEFVRWIVIGEYPRASQTVPGVRS